MFLDGNTAAGELSEIFTMDITTAICECNACGKTEAFAEAHVYAMEPGLIVRCRFCESPLMRIVKTSGRVWLDLRGLHSIQLAM